MGSPLNVNPTSTTTYTVTGTDLNGCQGTGKYYYRCDAATEYFVSATPNQICPGQSSTITLSGAATYTLQPGNLISIGSAFVLSPTVTTTYTVTGTNSDGCIGTSQILIGISDNCGQYCANPVILAIPDGTNNITNPITTAFVDILGTYTISSSVNYNNVKFRMAPNSQIIVAPGITLGLTRCQFFSCTEMWNGIFISNNTSTLIAKSCRFEDAISAVNSISGGNYTIGTSVFNKNYTGISISAYTPANPSTVKSTVFECNSSLNSPGATLKPPYLNTTSHYGIDIVGNSGGITFGVAGGGQNEFRNIDLGIHSSNSKITVHNNYFHDLRRHCIQVPMDDPCQAEGWGIWAETFGELYVGNIATTDLFNNPYSNTFRNCDGGIMAQVHVRKIEIYKNKFEGIGSLVVAEPNRKAISIISNF
ncbi:MAG: hypothetical protein IPG89_07400 [Bacteroidetes bacterium]|nr:hypothetical protein [Bacteroidota bacterium]